MQALTLEVIQRVIFGSRDPELRDALREALDLTGSTAAAGGDVAARAGRRSRARCRARASSASTRCVDAARMRRAAGRRGRLDPRPRSRASGATREELRDQLVTLLAAGHETTATALAWALERLARHPATDLSDDAHIDAAVKEVLRTRPVLSITARKTLQPYRAGRLHAPARRLRRRLPVPRAPPRRHRLRPARASSTARQTRTRSSRSAAARAAASAPRSPRWRCARCSERSHNASHLRPDRAQGERMRRRSVTLAPARGGSIVPYTR